jgi:ectoine hydroxylase-related dioxygenase (phytanoyl-CoA dioxygenase family)
MIPAEGFGSFGPLLEPKELEQLRGELDDWASTAVPNPYGLLHHNLWTVLPGFRRLVEDGRIATRVCDILDLDSVVFFQDNLVVKLPGNPTQIQWHQDYSYWPLDRPWGLTTWLALDPVDALNGGLRFVAGSHQWGERSPADFFEGSGQPALSGLAPLEPDQHPSVCPSVMPGELCFHHPLVWHCSGPNHRERPRRAWTATWVHPSVRWRPAHAPHPDVWRLGVQDGDMVRGPTFPELRR